MSAAVDLDLPVDSTVLLNQISDYIFTSKYARYLPDLKRRETWVEATNRVEAMHLRKFADLSTDHLAEIVDAFNLVRDKRVAPSMRSMQFGGPAVEAHNARIFNCAVRHVDSIRSFSEIFYLLLCGCGVGIGLTSTFLHRLPNLVSAENKTGIVTTYVIEDSIEGWADSLEALLNSYFVNTAYTGRKIVFDYSRIRPKGAPLKTGGGKAPGHLGLKNAHTQIKKLLDRIIEEEGVGRLRSIDAYDVLMHAADAVLSGGVRRSATCVVFDKDDELMLNAKTGDWHVDNPQRARSNNSVLLMRDEISEEEFMAIAKRTREWGEPGFVFANDPMTLFNPCFEVSFVPVTDDGVAGVQFCVSGDTTLMTRTGKVAIADAVGQDTEIWNGEAWKTVQPFQTGVADKLYRVSFSDGSYLDATNSHKFLVKAPWWNFYREMTTLEIMEWNESHDRRNWLSIPRANVKSDSVGGEVEYAYEYGFFKGDGFLDHGVPKCNLWGEDALLGVRGESMGHFENVRGTKFETLKLTNLDYEFCPKFKAGLPTDVWTWSHESVMEFFAGWIDADGSQANDGCRLYGDQGSLRDAQMLLTKHGVVASLNLMAEAGTATNLGERRNDVWYLQIPNASSIPSRRLHLSDGKDARWKGKNQIVTSVVELPGLHASYCLEELELHQCVFNNVLTKQCNLTTVNGEKVQTEEDFYECVRAAALIGTLQASYTEFPYLSHVAKELTDAEALLGVSITAMMSHPDIILNPEIQRRAAEIVVETNRMWAAIIGINQAARTCVIKPEGTSTLAFGSMFSGIHAAHARIMWRRVQANKEDNVYKFFKQFNPHLCEPSVWSANGTDDVITFPIIVPNGIVKEDLKALEHLEIIRSTQANWVLPGTTEANTKDVAHNVSCTVIVQEHEWDEVNRYLYANKDSFAAVSLLAATGDKDYAQAPNESVNTEEERQIFLEMVNNLIEVDYTLMIEHDDETDLMQEAACVGMQCEVR